MRVPIFVAIFVPALAAVLSGAPVFPVIVAALVLALLQLALVVGFRRGSRGGFGAVVGLVLHESVIRSVIPAAFGIGSLALVGLSRAASGAQTAFDQLQSELTWGLHLGIAVGVATVAFTACGTVAGEFETRSASLLFSKPLRRGSFIVGKSIGSFLVGFVVLVALTVQLGVSVRSAMAQCEDAERVRLEQELAVGRASFEPQPLVGPEFEAEVQRAWKEAANQRTELFRELGREAFVAEVRSELQEQWQTRIPPGRERTFVYDALPAKSRNLQLALQPSIYPPPVDELIRIWLQISDAEPELHTFVNGQPSVLELPEIPSDGRLTIRMENADHEERIEFHGEAGPELLVAVRSFELNMAAGVLLAALELLVAAFFSVLVASFTGLPVALFSMITLAGVVTIGPFLAEFVVGKTRRGPAPDQAVERVIEFIHRGGEILLEGFAKVGQISPVEELSAGRVLGIGEVGSALLWIGLGVGGGAALVTIVLFRRREIERVQLR